MYTVIETPVYAGKVKRILTDDERDAFAVFVAQKGKGKSGGARAIYYNRLENGEIWLLTIYAKSDRSTIPSHELKLIKEVIDRD